MAAHDVEIVNLLSQFNDQRRKFGEKLKSFRQSFYPTETTNNSSNNVEENKEPHINYIDLKETLNNPHYKATFDALAQGFRFGSTDRQEPYLKLNYDLYNDLENTIRENMGLNDKNPLLDEAKLRSFGSMYSKYGGTRDAKAARYKNAQGLSLTAYDVAKFLLDYGGLDVDGDLGDKTRAAMIRAGFLLNKPIDSSNNQFGDSSNNQSGTRQGAGLPPKDSSIRVHAGDPHLIDENYLDNVVYKLVKPGEEKQVGNVRYYHHPITHEMSIYDGRIGKWRLLKVDTKKF